MDTTSAYTIAMFALGFSVAALGGVFVLFGKLHDKGLLDKTSEPAKKTNKNGSLFRF